jgi:hypothetical protein
VAKGAITELGAKVKAGKTTFVMELAGATLDGGSFLDQPTFKTCVVYLTEQPVVSFRKAMERAKLLGARSLSCCRSTRPAAWGGRKSRWRP